MVQTFGSNPRVGRPPGRSQFGIRPLGGLPQRGGQRGLPVAGEPHAGYRDRECRRRIACRVAQADGVQRREGGPPGACDADSAGPGR